MSEQDRQQPDTDRDQVDSRDGAREDRGDLQPRAGESRGLGRPDEEPRDGEGQHSEPRAHARLIDRRTLLKSGLLAGGALAGGGAALADLAAKQASVSAAKPVGKRSSLARGAGTGKEQSIAGASRKTRVPAARVPPNILVIMVDQLRTPQWFSAGAIAAATTPNITGLANVGVSFANHYTASNDCTPSRAALLTGLYTHQTGCMITGGSTLDPGFPTWGTMLREQGYKTYWYGKWHLTHGDNLWEAQEDAGALEPYGFAGGTYPSPDGAPGQGWRVDPYILSQFEKWFARSTSPARSGAKPWCTTVSFVNPHDIAWWYRWSDRFAAEASAASVVGVLPPNFETPEEMIARGKPALQRSLQDTAQTSFGTVPYTGPEVTQTWLSFLNLYMKLLGEVDAHVGAVLQTLAEKPAVAANTVVVFTSDHGEYGASHGMRGKGASAYEEAIRVPLIVSDPRGVLTPAKGHTRTGLTSSVDVAPMLLDIATGSSDWRKQSDYSQIASRHDVAAMLNSSSAPGRAHVLHATDETVTEFATEPYAADVPLHVVALRTPTAKYATYSNFEAGSIAPLAAGQEAELYDYSNPQGRMELDNLAGASPLEEKLSAQLQLAVREELREPLPTRLYAAHKRGLADYFNTAEEAALKAAERRLRRTEAESEPPTQATPIEAPIGGEDEVGLDDSTKLRARRRADQRKSIRRTR
jgi:arylsulfatase A-like enzyme